MKFKELNEITGEIETHTTQECSRCDEPSERYTVVNGEVICPCCITSQDINPCNCDACRNGDGH